MRQTCTNSDVWLVYANIYELDVLNIFIFNILVYHYVWKYIIMYNKYIISILLCLKVYYYV